MKISKLIAGLQAMQAEHGDVKVRAVAPVDSGFLHCDKILHRNDYYDEYFFGGEVEKGNFVVIEWGKDD